MSNPFLNADGRMSMDEIRGHLQKVQSQIQALPDIRTAITALEGSATSEDERITVTVGPSGALKSLVLDPRAMRMQSHELAEAIVETAKLAADDVQKGLSAQLTELTGDEDEADAMASSAVSGDFEGTPLEALTDDNLDPTEKVNRIMEQFLGGKFTADAFRPKDV